MATVNMTRRLMLFPAGLCAAGLCAIVPSALACGSGIDAQPGIMTPKVENGRIPYILRRLEIGQASTMRLGVRAEGDRWEVAEGGRSGRFHWQSEPFGDPPGIKLWMQGMAAGVAEIALRYRPAGQPPVDTGVRVTIAPPAPPPPPPTFDVDRAEFTGQVDDARDFRLRMVMPVPEGYRWEVGEAVAEFRGRSSAVAVRADAADPTLFTARGDGETMRIVMVQRRDGFQLFPDTVTIRLSVRPTPKC